jgi:hypothetical protein
MTEHTFTERPATLRVIRADPTVRPRKNHGRVKISLIDGHARAVHRTTGEVKAEATIVESRSLPMEEWRLVADNGDVWKIGRDCGCGG